MRSQSIDQLRDALTKRFERLVCTRAKATGMCICEFREWIDELVGEGIAVALNDIDKWDETRGNFLYWAFLKTRCLVNKDLEKRQSRLRTVRLQETTIDQRESNDPERDFLLREQLKEIFEILTRKQKQALILRHLMGMSIKELESMTGRSDVSLRSLLQRGKKKAQELRANDWRELPRAKGLNSNRERGGEQDREVS
jgi:RNA polymerase sigma factor (sigma-70 family)